ncbi:MAG: hypothetical protein AAB973_04160 [Patescibacteria group bacterium]
MDEDTLAINNIYEIFIEFLKYAVLGIVIYFLTLFILDNGIKSGYSLALLNAINVFGIGIIKFIITKIWVFKQ